MGRFMEKKKNQIALPLEIGVEAMCDLRLRSSLISDYNIY